MTIESAKVSIVVATRDGSVFSFEFPTAKNVTLDSEAYYVENQTNVGEAMLVEFTEISLGFKAFKNQETGLWCKLDTPKPEVEDDPLVMISKLIVDMSFGQATRDELNRAIQYSKTVLDSSKSPTNLLKSYVAQGIQELQDKYDGGNTNGE